MRKGVAAAALMLAALAVPQAQADDVADFYRGKRINLIVSYGTGGGYDVYARVLAKYMSQHIPGNPNIIVQNMPGAGSLRGANYIYNVAARDGTVFGTFARNIALIGHLKTNQNVQYDPAKCTWLGSSSSLAKNRAERNVIEILEIPHALSRPQAAPPDIPLDRAMALQHAIMESHEHPDDLADREGVGIEVTPYSGYEIRQLLDKSGKTPAD